MKKLFLLVIITAMIHGDLFSQDNSPFTRAQKLQRTFAYSEAIPLYLKALDQNPDKPEALRGIGECFRLTNQTEQAETYYRKLVTGGKGVESNDKLRLAQMLMANANYTEAQQYFTEYSTTTSADERAKNQLEAIHMLDSFLKDSVRYKISNGKFNSSNSDFSPARFSDGFVFVSSRGRGGVNDKTHSWTGDPFLSLFYAKGSLEQISNVAPFAEELKSEYNDGPACFSAKGDEMFLTRNNSKLPFRNDKTARLKIVVSKLENGKWTEAADLPFNRAQYSTAHACLSIDGKRLYFASDMPGGSGGMDIYYSDRVESSWSNPVNMGKQVNTSGNEAFPYIGPDGSLYFSSDGWPGLGGLDVFKIDLNSSEKPRNAGYPINTHKDDFGVWFSADMKYGMLSSNRNGGAGDDDVWIFEFINKLVIYGTVADKETLTPIPNAPVVLKDSTGNIVATAVTDADGKYAFEGEYNMDYSISSNPEGWFAGSKDFTTKGISNDSLEVDLLLEKIIINKPIVIENIYYDFDKWNIRRDAAIELDKLVVILKDNPKIVIVLGSHTDSRGSDAYNEILSQRRAQSAVDYIVKIGGISQDRISAKGYGETILVNRCKNDIPCSAAEHQQNRRTEFKVVSH
ncbi:MAG: OmpA family protein [Bacteroidota bacterium]